jgi:hypothetical protein
VSHHDYWTWSAGGNSRAEKRTPEKPARLLIPEDEDEIERMYQTLKTVGHLDTHTNDPSKTSHEG